MAEKDVQAIRLSKDVQDRLLKLAASEVRSASQMGAILIEEALNARVHRPATGEGRAEQG